MLFFKFYGEASSQIVSNDKCMFFHGSLARGKIDIIRDCLGFGEGSLPFTLESLKLNIFSLLCTELNPN